MPRLGSRGTVDFDVRNEPVPWAVGEHVAIIGTTGTGKTYLTSKLLEWRQYIAVLRTKPDDIKFKGFHKVADAKALATPNRYPKLLISPDFRRQRIVAADLFDTVWNMGNWTIVIDELFYVHDTLGMKDWVNMLLTQGRSKRISVVVGMQRPVSITRFALSESTHIMSFRLEKRDAKTLGEASSDVLAEATLRVPPYHFAHWYVKGRSLAVGTADRLDKVLLPPAHRATLRDDGSAPAGTGDRA